MKVGWVAERPGGPRIDSVATRLFSHIAWAPGPSTVGQLSPRARRLRIHEPADLLTRARVRGDTRAVQRDDGSRLQAGRSPLLQHPVSGYLDTGRGGRTLLPSIRATEDNAALSLADISLRAGKNARSYQSRVPNQDGVPPPIASNTEMLNPLIQC